MAAFSLSNGWLTSCALMHAPEAVPPSERGRASSLMICFLNVRRPRRWLGALFRSNLAPTHLDARTTSSQSPGVARYFTALLAL